MPDSQALESFLDSLRAGLDSPGDPLPLVFRAPGRVNLIGEHTDYNDGFVMPAAIEFYTWVAVSERRDRIVQVQSNLFNERAEFSLDALAEPPRKHWSDMVRGVAAVLQDAGNKLVGANLVIHGEVPVGAGLSSSASVEVAVAMAVLGISQVEVPPLEIVKLCQRAEHEYVGTQCGIMDQFIAVFGRSGGALMLDCRSLGYELLPIPETVRIVICNSMVKHELAGGEYNRRRADCETGVDILRQHMPNVAALRDVTIADLERYRDEMPLLIYRRCHHVVTENERVLSAADALRSSNLEQFGHLMYESHRSLRQDYEVSSAELDKLVEIASACDGVYGSRMTGGGFGGCTVNLVRSDAVDSFKAKIEQSYKLETGIVPDVYVCSAAGGAGRWQEA